MVDNDVQMKHKYISISSEIIYDLFSLYIYKWYTHDKIHVSVKVYVLISNLTLFIMLYIKFIYL